MKPVDASFVGSATVWFALDAGDEDAAGDVAARERQRVAVVLEQRRALLGVPLDDRGVAVLRAELAVAADGRGRFAVPVRSPPTPPGFVQAAVGIGSQPSIPKRSSW